jgi:hypothetical protein
MAGKRSLLFEAAALLVILRQLAIAASNDITNLHGNLDDQGLSKVDLAAALAEAFPILMARYVMGAANTTASWYEDLSPESNFRASVPDIDFSERLGKSAKWAVLAPGDATIENRLIGVGQRAIFDGSRQTVIDNAKDEDVRYARIARPDACEFCKMLSLRGAVYWTKESAGKGHTIDAGHDHCYCTIVPVRGGKWHYTMPDHLKEFQKQYDAAVEVLPSAKNYKGKNTYMKAILAKIREQAKGVDIAIDLPDMPINLDAPSAAQSLEDFIRSRHSAGDSNDAQIVTDFLDARLTKGGAR